MKQIIGSLLLAGSICLVAGCGGDREKKNTFATQAQGKGTHMVQKKTASGLGYDVIQEGTGAAPKAGQKVTVHYTGWLDANGEPGTKFDSSVDRKQPFSFTVGVGQVIQGWDEGLMLMRAGGKYRLRIPAALGYGAYGAGRLIPPHANLIFDVELLQVG